MLTDFLSMSGHRTGDGDGGVGAAVTLGLLAAWVAHDLEEVVTVPGWARNQVPELRGRFPRVPERMWQRLESIDGREFATAVAGMAVVVTAAAADGHRTGGRSDFYQRALNAFGLHALMHVAQSAAVRGYTPGVVTSPLVVIPFTLWARDRLRQTGVLRPTQPRDVLEGLLLAAAATAGTHAVARRILRRGRATPPS